MNRELAYKARLYYQLLFGLLIFNSASYGVVSQDWLLTEAEANVSQEKPKTWYVGAYKAYNDNAGLIKTFCGVAIVLGGCYVVQKRLGDLQWVTHKQFMLRSAALEAIVNSSKLELLARIDLLETNLANQIKGIKDDIKNMATDSNLKMDQLATTSEDTKKMMMALLENLRRIFLHINELRKIEIPASTQACIVSKPSSIATAQTPVSFLEGLQWLNREVSEFAFPSGQTR